MRAEKISPKHLAALAAVFILGDSVIVLPSPDSGKFVFWGFLLSVAAAAAVFFAAVPVSSLIAGAETTGAVRGAVCIPLLAAAAFYSFYGAGLALKRYMGFVDRVLLPDTQRFFIAFIFIFLAAVLASRRKDVISKLSLIFIVISAITVVLFFALSVKDFRRENIAVYRLPEFSELIEEAIPCFFTVSLPAALIPIYTSLLCGERKKGASFAGLSAGLALVGLCLVECLLLFGAPLSANLDFPLASAVSTVTVGPLFTRMDGLVYCLFFGTALIKTSFCMKLCFYALSHLKNALRRNRGEQKK